MASTRKATRTQVRDAVVALLGDMVTSQDVNEVRAYNGELSAKLPEDVLRALNGLTPGILVATETGLHKGIQVQRRRTRRDIGIVLYLASTSQDTRENRADELARLEDMVIERLIGVTLALDVACGALEPVSERVLAHEPHVCIWQQEWRVTVEQDFREPPAAPVTEMLGRLNAPQDEDNAADPMVVALTTAP